MCKNWFHVLFSENQIVTNNKDRNVAAGSRGASLYVLSIAVPQRAHFTSIETCYARLGHSSSERILQMPSTDVAKNRQICSKVLPNACEVWSLCSQTCSNIPKTSNFGTTKTLARVHSELCGLLETVSKGSARYLVLFIDHFSKWSFSCF